MSQPKRPKDCPLFLHGNGQWAKKVKGKFRYFGSDLDAALRRWANDKDHLIAGYDPPRADGKATMAELANLYVAHSQERVSSGLVRADHSKDVKAVLGIVVGAVGGSAKPDTMRPQQWVQVRAALGTKGSGEQVAHTTLRMRLSLVRAFLNWSRRMKLVSTVDTASALDPPPRRLLRLESQSRGKRLWAADDIRAVIEASPILFRPVVLLGINAAMGALDIASLTRSQFSPKLEYLDCPRNKTGIERRVWLWPETRQAIAAAVAKRPEPAKQKYDNRLLLSLRGCPWSRVEASGTVDLTRKMLVTVKADAGVARGCFYDFRRTFRTVASKACDREATDHVMGHEGSGQGGIYLQEIPDDRIRRVCECVRGWLFDGVEQ